jgi:hypothetical protein
LQSNRSCRHKHNTPLAPKMRDRKHTAAGGGGRTPLPSKTTPHPPNKATDSAAGKKRLKRLSRCYVTPHTPSSNEGQTDGQGGRCVCRMPCQHPSPQHDNSNLTPGRNTQRKTLHSNGLCTHPSVRKDTHQTRARGAAVPIKQCAAGNKHQGCVYRGVCVGVGVPNNTGALVQSRRAKSMSPTNQKGASTRI